MVLCLLWCPWHDSVYCCAQNMILCLLWCPWHDSVYCCAQDMLEGSQGQYIQLEKKLKVDFGALEKKYHKAKKLIKEYQQRSVLMHSQVCIGSFVCKSPVCHQAGWAHGKPEATVPRGCFLLSDKCFVLTSTVTFFEWQVLCNDIHSKSSKPEETVPHSFFSSEWRALCLDIHRNFFFRVISSLSWYPQNLFYSEW